MAKHVKREVDRGSGASGPRIGRGARNGIRLASALAALLVGAGAAVAQPTVSWVAQEFIDPQEVGYYDEGVEAVFCVDGSLDPPVEYAYVVGTLVTGSGESVLAVYKYEVVPNERDPGEYLAAYRFPPVGETEGPSGGAGIAIDGDGNVIVVGYTPMLPNGEYPEEIVGSSSNYVTIKLNKDLTAFTDWTTTHGPYPGVRIYNGPDDGADAAIDVGLDRETDDVFVTGTSFDEDTGRDIVSLKYIAATGAPDTTWSGDGVVRYNNDAEDGDDVAAELAIAYVVVSEDTLASHLIVVGSSEGYGTGWDIVTLHYDAAGGEAWVHRLATEADEFGTGIAKHDMAPPAEEVTLDLFVGGYGIKPPDSFSLYSNPGMTMLIPVPDYDYIAFALDPVTGGYEWTAPGQEAVHYWDGDGGQFGNDDFCADIAFWGTPAPTNDGWVVLTGRSRTGQYFDCATVAILNGEAGWEWEAQYAASDGEDGGAAVRISDYGVFVGGWASPDEEPQDYLLLNYDLSNGGLNWDVLYDFNDEAGEDVGYGLALSSTGASAVVTGALGGDSTNGMGFDFGTVLWEP